MALAVATLWDGNAGFRCAILGWCQSASAFGRELSLARPGGAARFDLLLLLPLTKTRFHAPRPGCGNALNRFARKAHSSGLAAEAKSENIATASG